MDNNRNIVHFIYKINKSMYDGSEGQNEITELQMHKILFFVYGSFYNQFKKELWNANFEAWKYGPVEINYREMSNHGDNEKYKLFNFKFDINNEQKEFLKILIVRLLKTSVWALVDFSHYLNCWKLKYESDEKQKVMDKNEIFNDFKNIRI